MSPRKIETPEDCPEIWQVDSTVNGQARYVVHYLAIPYVEDESEPFYVNQNNHIEHARAALYGQKYRAKWYGGGIVFQAYAGNPVQHVLDAINRAQVSA